MCIPMPAGIRFHKLLMVVKQYSDVGNQTQVFCKDINAGKSCAIFPRNKCWFLTDTDELGLQLTFLCEEMNQL